MAFERFSGETTHEAKSDLRETVKTEVADQRVDTDKRLWPLPVEPVSSAIQMSGFERLLARASGYSEPAINLAKSLQELQSGGLYSKDLQQEVAQPPKQLELLKSQGLEEGQVGEFKALTNPVVEDKAFLEKTSMLVIGGELKQVTNLERMRLGKAPIGEDGRPIELHHCGQKQTSTLAELSSSFHKEHYTDLHANTGGLPSQIDRHVFDKQRVEYWKARAAALESR